MRWHVRWLLLVALATSCGRVYFDPRDDGGTDDAAGTGVFTPVVLPAGGRANGAVIDATSGDLYVWYSRRGGFRSSDDGMSWTECAPAVAETMLVAPDGTVYLAIDGGDVLASADHCATWSATGGRVTEELAHDGLRLLAATDVGLRAYDGNVWSVVTTPFEGTAINTVAVSASTILIGSTLGVARSVDGGQGWTIQNGGLSNFDVVSIAFAPSQPTRAYAVEGSIGGDTGGLFRSNDGGQNWTRLSGNGGTHVVVDPADPDHVVFANFNKIQEVTDGASVNDLIAPELDNALGRSALFDGAGGCYLATTRGLFYRQGTGPFSPRFGTIDAWRLERGSTSATRDRVVFATDAGTLCSEDGGKSFTLTTTDFGLNSSVEDVIVSTTPDTVYACSRFIASSTDRGMTFSTVFDSGVGNGFGVNALVESGTRLIGATQVQVVISDPPLATWTNVMIGGAAQACHDLAISTRGVAVVCDGGVYESTNNAQSFQLLAGAPPGGTRLVGLGDTWFLGTSDGLFTYTGSTWSRRGLDGDQVYDVLIEGSSWVAATDNAVQVSTNAGLTWTVMPGLAGRNPRSLERDVDGALLVGTAGYGLYRAQLP